MASDTYHHSFGTISLRSIDEKVFGELTGDQALQTAFGVTSTPSPSTISRYKNHILGEQTFELAGLSFLLELQRRGAVDVMDLVADGAQLKAYLNTKRLQAPKELPYDTIRVLFDAQDLSKWEKILVRGTQEKFLTVDY